MADDVASETFLIAFRRRAEFDPGVGRAWCGRGCTASVRRHAAKPATGESRRTENVELIIDQQTYQVLASTKNHQVTTDSAGNIQTLPSQSVYTDREWTDQKPAMPAPPK